MVLVTGGTGFVGAHLLLELLKNNQKVKAIKRNNSNLNLVKRIFSYYKEDVETLLSQIEWVDGDVLDVLSLQEAMENPLRPV